MIARKYNLVLNPDLVYLIESLKVEGYWNPKHYTATIVNKNLNFLRKIESILKGIGIKPYKRILVKIKLKDKSLSKENIIFERGGNKLNFHFETSPFDGSKKVVTSQSYSKPLNLRLSIKKKAIRIKIKEEENEFRINSDLNGFVYLTLTIPSIHFIKFISNLVKNKKKLRIEPYLYNSKVEDIMSAFSALIDCEGSLDHYGFFRKIRIRMFSKKYLHDWKGLLEKYGVYARFSRNSEKEYELCIEGWEDLNRLKELGLRLYHSKKKIKFDEMLSSYKINQVSRNSAEEYYLRILKEIDEPVSATDLAKYANKSKRVVNHYIRKLKNKNKIKAREVGPNFYLYSVR